MTKPIYPFDTIRNIHAVEAEPGVHIYDAVAAAVYLTEIDKTDVWLAHNERLFLIEHRLSLVENWQYVVDRLERFYGG